jgi:hypothetical protein
MGGDAGVHVCNKFHVGTFFHRSANDNERAVLFGAPSEPRGEYTILEGAAQLRDNRVEHASAVL